MAMKALLLFGMLLIVTFSYLQLKITRIPSENTLKTKDKVQCVTPEIDTQLQNERKKNKSKKKNDDDSDEDEDDSEYQDDEVDEDENYKQICYEKDISYGLPLYYNNQIRYFSMDLTAPVSWLKGQKCHIQASSKQCTFISTNLKQALQGIAHSVSKHFSKKSKKKHQKLAMIEGSSELVKGLFEKSRNLTFVTRDSNRITKLTELVMLGFWMKGQKDTLQIQNTTFINATEISSNLNSLCDGAISLRFDDMSQNSFLKELFDYEKTSEKVVTVYLGPLGKKITIGELATKNAQYGYGGISWIKIQDDESYGKLPIVTDLIIEDQDQDEDSFQQFNDIEMPIAFSMSASYIGLPKKLLDDFSGQYKSDRQCGINNQSGYFECNKIKKGDLDKILTFVFDSTKISFTLEELVIKKSHKKVVFNIKKTFHDEYAIMGEPAFKKYYTILDYGKNRIGIAQPRTTQIKQFINIVTLVRFISVVFIFGCSFILCFSPVQKCVNKLKVKGYKFIGGRGGKENSSEKRRLKQYSPVSDENYDDLNDKVKEVLENDSSEVEGI